MTARTFENAFLTYLVVAMIIIWGINGMENRFFVTTVRFVLLGLSGAGFICYLKRMVKERSSPPS